MRPMMILCLSSAALIGLIGLTGACASSRPNTAGADACTQRCSAASLSALERSTCELDCSRLAAAPPTTPPTPPTTSPPQPPTTPPTTSPPQPLPPQQPQPQPIPPQSPPPQPLPPRAPPPTPTPQPVGPATTHYTLPPGGGPPVPTYAHPQGTSTTPQGAPQPAPVDRQAIANCESNCLRENLSATDQETCRLNCNAVGTVYAPAPSYNVYSGKAPSEAEQRAAVIRSSGGIVPTSPTSPPPAQPGQPPPASPAKVAQCAAQSQQCSTTCATQLEPCNRGCEQGKMSNTDRATCKLTCQNTTDLCRDDCRINEGRCRSTP